MHDTPRSAAAGAPHDVDPDIDLDVLIVGAGLSGIDAAAMLRQRCPDKRFTVLEVRAALGGTWDLFRYPGVRADSDMYTLGYGFRPWTGANAPPTAPQSATTSAPPHANTTSNPIFA